MYYAKLTKAEKQIKLGKLQRARTKMENTKETQTMLLAWRRFLKLPYAEQRRQRNEWEEYYKKVKTTNAYLIFLKQRDAGAINDHATVKELAETARAMRLQGLDNEIPMPRSIDPFEFDSGTIVKAYQDIERSIKELTDYSPEADEIREGAQVFA